MRLLISTFVSLLFTILLVQAACPPTEDALNPITTFLVQEFRKVALLKPGSDPKDAAFLLSNALKSTFELVPTPSVTKDTQKLVEQCYKPADFSTRKAQDAFKNCATRQLPQLLMKYASSGLKACSAFEKEIIPKWESKYKARAVQYFSDFVKMRTNGS